MTDCDSGRTDILPPLPVIRSGEPTAIEVTWLAQEPQRIGTHPGDHRLRQSMSLAVMRNTTASANCASR
jgi:hypothetical protein